MSSCPRPKSQILFRLNLDASRVSEALVNSFRLLTPLRTRLNPPEPKIPSKTTPVRIFVVTRLFFANSFNSYPVGEEIEVADSENRTPESKFRPKIPALRPRWYAPVNQG